MNELFVTIMIMFIVFGTGILVGLIFGVIWFKEVNG